MKSLKELVKEFAVQGYANPLIHAEAKLWALQKIALAKQYSAPSLKSNPKPIMQSPFQKAIRHYLNKGGAIQYLAEKLERHSDRKVAIPQQPVVRYRSLHKLSPQEAIELALARGLA
jgi:hypothetical protein